MLNLGSNIVLKAFNTHIACWGPSACAASTSPGGSSWTVKNTLLLEHKPEDKRGGGTRTDWDKATVNYDTLECIVRLIQPFKGREMERVQKSHIIRWSYTCQKLHNSSRRFTTSLTALLSQVCVWCVNVCAFCVCVCTLYIRERHVRAHLPYRTRQCCPLGHGKVSEPLQSRVSTRCLRFYSAKRRPSCIWFSHRSFQASVKYTGC